jgi:hypothetical protein
VKLFVLLLSFSASIGSARSEDQFLLKQPSIKEEALTAIYQWPLKDLRKGCTSNDMKAPALTIFGTLTNDCTSNSQNEVQKLSKASKPISVYLSDYETMFFGPIVREQLASSKCLAGHLDSLDMDKNYKGAQNAHIEILKGIYSQIPKIIEIENEIEKISKQLGSASSDVRAARLGPIIVQHVLKERTDALKKLEEKLATQVKLLHFAKSKIWAGHSEEMGTYLSYWIGEYKRKSFDERTFIANGLNPERPSKSIQTLVMQMKSNNNQRIALANEAKPPYSDNLKRSLVLANSHDLHADDLNRKEEMSEFLCFLDARYGRGRESFFYFGNTAVELAAGFAIPATFARYAASGVTLSAVARTVEVAGVFYIVGYELLANQKGSCRNGEGFRSVVNSKICEDLAKSKSTDKAMSFVTKQIDEQLSCTEASGVMLAAVATASPLSAGGKVFKTERSLLKYGRSELESLYAREAIEVMKWEKRNLEIATFRPKGSNKTFSGEVFLEKNLQYAVKDRSGNFHLLDLNDVDFLKIGSREVKTQRAPFVAKRIPAGTVEEHVKSLRTRIRPGFSGHAKGDLLEADTVELVLRGGTPIEAISVKYDVPGTTFGPLNRELDLITTNHAIEITESVERGFDLLKHPDKPIWFSKASQLEDHFRFLQSQPSIMHNQRFGSKQKRLVLAVREKPPIEFVTHLNQRQIPVDIVTPNAGETLGEALNRYLHSNK